MKISKKLEPLLYFWFIN